MIHHRSTALLAVTLAALVAGTALAHKGATGIVKERMDHMKAVGDATKEIGAMVKGEQPFAADRVRALADLIGTKGGARMNALFEEKDMTPPSESRAEIWTDWDRFADLSDQVELRAGVLARAMAEPGADLDTARTLFKDLAGTCRSCHQDFRVKK